MAKKKLKPTPESIAYDNYLSRTGFAKCPITTALIDMDGVLFNSMPNHSKAWERLAREYGWKHEPNEFFLYEGMTGANIIKMMFRRGAGKNLTDEEAWEYYKVKGRYFNELGEPEMMPGAKEVLQITKEAGLRNILVTGSNQPSIL